MAPHANVVSDYSMIVTLQQVAVISHMRTYFIKAALSYSQNAAQVHECLLIANYSMSCSQAAGTTAGKADDHLWCHHTLDGLSCPFAMRVSQRLECGSHTAAAAVLVIQCVVRRISHARVKLFWLIVTASCRKGAGREPAPCSRDRLLPCSKLLSEPLPHPGDHA